MNEWSYTSSSLICLHGVDADSFTFCQRCHVRIKPVTAINGSENQAVSTLSRSHVVQLTDKPNEIEKNSV